jgi:hypothetical protein
VLPVLTRYLLQYKKLSIPHVGSFELVQHSPEFDVADKMITPPRYLIHHDPSVSITVHQIGFLASSVNSDEATVSRQLEDLGERIKEIAADTSFRWNGIGILSLIAGRMKFENDFPAVFGLSSVQAHKVLRENVEHSRMVGDRETAQPHARSVARSSKRSLISHRIGWIILAISILVIAFILYSQHFSPMGAGLQWKVIGQRF